MLAAFPTASLYGSAVRLLVWLLPLVVFVVLLPRPAPRPLPHFALGALVCVWGFAAALIWSTAGPTKVRFGFLLAGSFGSWVLLACVFAGTLAAAAAARAFAHEQHREGRLYGATLIATFLAWSYAVRYSPLIAAAGLLIGVTAIARASRPLAPAKAANLAEQPKYLGTVTGLVWTGAVLAAGIAFTAWASVQLAAFGQSCPWGFPGEGHPLRVGSLTAVGAVLVVLLARGRSHTRGVVIALGIGAACTVGLLDLVGWWLVGVGHYCSD